MTARHGFSCRHGYAPFRCTRLWIGTWLATMYGGWPAPRCDRN